MSRTRMDSRSDEDEINDPSSRFRLGRTPESSRNDQKELGETSVAQNRDRSRSPIHNGRTPSPLSNSNTLNKSSEGTKGERSKEGSTEPRLLLNMPPENNFSMNDKASVETSRDRNQAMDGINEDSSNDAQDGHKFAFENSSENVFNDENVHADTFMNSSQNWDEQNSSQHPDQGSFDGESKSSDGHHFEGEGGQMDEEEVLGAEPQQLVESSFANESNNANVETQDSSHDAPSGGNQFSDENGLSEFQNDFYENLLDEEEPPEDAEDALQGGDQLPPSEDNLTSSQGAKKTPPIFNYLPARVLESDEVRRGEGAKDTCPICREELKDLDMLRLLPCSHEFHSDCVDDWLMRTKSCPLCRSALSRAHLR